MESIELAFHVELSKIIVGQMLDLILKMKESWVELSEVGLSWLTFFQKMLNWTCETKYKMSPSSVRSEGGEEAAGYLLNSVSYRVDEAVKYNVLNSD